MLLCAFAPLREIAHFFTASDARGTSGKTSYFADSFHENVTGCSGRRARRSYKFVEPYGGVKPPLHQTEALPDNLSS